MKRITVLAMLLSLLVAPIGASFPRGAAAATTTTVVTTDRATGQPVRGACYSVSDLVRGGGVAAGCDRDDGSNDGTTVLTAAGADAPCGQCRYAQGLPDDPQTGLPTDYLREPPIDAGWGGTIAFQNWAKPYVVATTLNARTGDLLPGICVAVQDLDRGGTVAGGCDGAAGDVDGARDGRITTKRLLTGNYRVNQTQVPAAYLRGASVDVAAQPGAVHQVTLQVPPKPRIVVKTVDAATGARLKGACYGIVDLTHGGGLGTLCDGQKNGDFGDQDGKRNGVVVTQPLLADTLYRLEQTKAPRGYRAAKDKDVTTVAGQDARITIKNRRAG